MTNKHPGMCDPLPDVSKSRPYVRTISMAQLINTR